MKDKVLNDLAVAMLECYHALEDARVEGIVAVFNYGGSYYFAPVDAELEKELVAVDMSKLSFTKLGTARTAKLITKATKISGESKWSEIAEKIRKYGKYNPNNGDIAEIAYKLAVSNEPETVKGKKEFYRKNCECFKSAPDVGNKQVKYLSSNCTLCNLSTITRTYTDGDTAENIKAIVEKAKRIEEKIIKYKAGK